MDSQKRNLLILAGLLGVWGLIFAFRPPWGTPVRPEARVTTPAHPQTPATQGGGLPRLKRELVNLPAPAYPPELQNIFGSPPPPPPPPQAAVDPAALAPPPPPPPDPFQEEAKRLRYVGFLQAGERAVAFIVAGSEVHTVEVGATIKERFRVQAITEDALLLSSVDGDKQVRLPLASDAAAPPRR
jgi:hypothetical protein